MLVVTLLVLVGTALGGSAVLFGPQAVRDLLHRSDGLGSSAAQPGSVADGPAQDALAQFVAALQAGDVSAINFAGAAPGTVPTELADITDGLKPYTLVATTQPAVMADDAAAQAPIQLTYSFSGQLAWTTSSQVALLKTDGQWQVRWAPSILEPTLGSGDTLSRAKVPGTRGSITGRGGAVLVGETAVVHIGIRPSRVQDLPTLTKTLQQVLGIDPADLTTRVQKAKPDDFVDVATVPKAQYETIRPKVFPLPGTVFDETTQPQALDDNFARALLGRSGEVTADIIQANPGQFEQGDIVGRSGLQAQYNGVLGGKPGLRISVHRATPNPASTTTATGLTTTSAIRDPNVADELFSIAPTPGQNVVTTIDPVVQKAAEAALAPAKPTSALVAIKISTGEVLAVANGPKGASVNFAMTGQYPPGSTFKVVSGYAVLRDALGPDDSVDCPANVTIQGRSFSNAENEVLGPIPFRNAFAQSCNTAFVNATRSFGLPVLHDAGSQFGLGVDYKVGVDVYTGSVPVNDSKVDLAASAFGQGRLLVSPFSEAVMAATAASGSFQAPQLVTSPAPAAPPAVEPLAAQPDATLQELMREVVTNGTGNAVLNVNGGPVHGKTGTAEFGNDNPPKTHAWFVGYQGDLAFAVFVEGGGFGGAVSAPIAATFLNAVAGHQ